MQIRSFGSKAAGNRRCSWSRCSVCKQGYGHHLYRSRYFGGIYQENGKYTFKVAPKATKTEIKDAIEKIFNVKVSAIRTINVKPKKRRVGRYTGLTNRYKKAIVSLAEGQTIDLG